VVDAVNDDYKAGIIGKVFRAFVKGELEKLEDFYIVNPLHIL
jgi:hypothetical protein